MALPKAEAAYNRHREAMTQALENPRGVAVKFSNFRDALNFRKMCHTIRSKDRKRIEDSLSPNQRYLASTPYDGLFFEIKPSPAFTNPDAHDLQIRHFVMPEIVPL